MGKKERVAILLLLIVIVQQRKARAEAWRGVVASARVVVLPVYDVIYKWALLLVALDMLVSGILQSNVWIKGTGFPNRLCCEVRRNYSGEVVASVDELWPEGLIVFHQTLREAIFDVVDLSLGEGPVD